MPALTSYSKSLWSYNPIPGNTAAYLPLWNPGLHGVNFKSIDPYGHTLTRTGGVMDGDGFTGDGDDDINIVDVLGAALQADATGTFMAWVKFDDVTPLSIEEIISLGHFSGTGFIILRLETDGKLRALSNDGAGLKWAVKTNSQVFTSTAIYYFVALVQDATEPVLYVGSTTAAVVKPAQGFGTATDKTIWVSVSSLNNGYIGAGDTSGSGKTRFLNGKVREVWVYSNRALTLAECEYTRLKSLR